MRSDTNFDRIFILNEMTPQELFESLKSARRKYPDVPFVILEKFMSADKSGTYKFVEKMCQFYDEGYNFIIIIPRMKEYQKYEVYLDKDNRDITNKTFDDILNDIEDCKLKKLNSVQQRKLREKQSGLIYEDDNIRIWCVGNFDDAQRTAKGTLWCTGQNESKYKSYSEKYDIYVILDKRVDGKFRKICYMTDGLEDFFVDSDNRHYFDTDKEYKELNEKYLKFLLK
jgi:hypothetical protein